MWTLLACVGSHCCSGSAGAELFSRFIYLFICCFCSWFQCLTLHARGERCYRLQPAVHLCTTAVRTAHSCRSRRCFWDFKFEFFEKLRFQVRFLNQQSRCFLSFLGRCSCWQEYSPSGSLPNIMVWLVAVDYSRSPLPPHPLLSPGRGPYWVTASCTSFRRSERTSAPTNQTFLTWVTKEGVRGSLKAHLLSS